MIAEEDLSIGRTLTSKYIYKQQSKHFVLLNILPNIAVLLSLLALPILPFGLPEIVAFLSLWIITGLGITAGYHRYFTHRAFVATPGFEASLAIAGSMAGQGGVVSWACLHRQHHQLSDADGDPHSPNLHGATFWERMRGLLHSHFIWMRRHPYPNPSHYVPDLMRNRRIMWINRHYYKWVILGLLAPAIAVGLWRGSIEGLVTGLIWGGIFRLVFLGHTIWAINSFLHMFGAQDHQTKDHSRNARWLGLLTFGESFHNTHHAHSRSALFGIGAAWLDPGYWFIRASAAAGFVKDVYVPEETKVERKRLT